MPERFHWIVPQKLAAMARPGLTGRLDRDLAVLHATGVRAVATLTERALPVEICEKSGLVFRHFPIDDFDVPTLDQVRDFCAWTDERIAAAEPVAVHCLAGLGRTGTMIACWIVRDPARTSVEVIRTLRETEPGYLQTPEQEAFVSVWEDTLRRRG